MKLGIMQPYFLPYIGYFQLIDAVDEFVVYDDIQFSKGGWIHRNRFLENGSDVYFTIPVKKDSDYLDIRDREVAGNFEQVMGKTLRRMTNAYRGAPHFDTGMELLEECFSCPETNLYGFIRHSIDRVCARLAIDTPIVVSSDIDIDASLNGQRRVLATCQARGAASYLNPIGGVELYDRATFRDAGVDLRFIRTRAIAYPQMSDTFVPSLSVIDVIMFNGCTGARELLEKYDVV
jgi:hypothetical protein